MFKKILIANRGEIAVRIIRACREMGIRTVAAYSDVDRAALHVRKADEAYSIGAAQASESYLNIERILDVARCSGADAIHPGYGFLSENPRFARACEPFVPGSSHGLELSEAQHLAAEIGYPVMLKAAAGGGGKGMRLVHAAGEMASAYEAARSEALRAFGDDEVYIE